MIHIYFIPLLFITHSSWAQITQIRELDVIIKTIENNYDAQIGKLDKDLSKAKSLIKKGEFDWDFRYNYSQTSHHRPAISKLEGAPDNKKVVSSTQLHSFSIDKKYEFGTKTSIPFGYSFDESNSIYRQYSSVYLPTMGVRVEQNIIQFINYFQSAQENSDFKIKEKQYDQSLNQLAFENLRLFFDGFYLQESLTIQAQELEHIKKLNIGLNKAQLDYDFSQMEYNKIKSIIIYKIFPQNADTIDISALKLHLDMEKLTLPTPNNTLKEEEKSEGLQITANYWPSLDIQYEYYTKGISTQLGSSWTPLRNNDFPQWKLSVTSTYPLWNLKALSESKVAQIELDMENIKKDQLHKKKILDEKINAITLDFSLKKIAHLEKELEDNKRNIEMAIAKKKRGFSSLIDVENALLSAKKVERQLLKAKVDLKWAHYKSYHTSGRLLDILL